MSEINDILSKLPAGQRKKVLNIMNSKTIANVYCDSKTCKGRLIGTIDADNSFHATIDKDGKMWARASRTRLDGYLGFECWCGQDSRLSKQEKDVQGIVQNSVTKKDIEEVMANLKKEPAHYETKDKKQKVDGFTIEEIR